MRTRPVMAFLGVAVLTAASVPALGSVAMAQVPASPTIWVSQDFDSILGGGWPAGVELTVTADDPATAPIPDIMVTTATSTTGEFQVFQVSPGLQPGWHVTVTGGGAAKTHIVGYVDITSVDPGTDVITGTADPSAAVYAGRADGPELILNIDFLAEGIWTAADSSGNWSADLSDVYNIMSGSRVGAALQMDADGDFTYTQQSVGLGYFSVNYAAGEEGANLLGGAWPAGVDLMATADNPLTVAAPDLVSTIATNHQGSFRVRRVSWCSAGMARHRDRR